MSAETRLSFGTCTSSDLDSPLFIKTLGVPFPYSHVRYACERVGVESILPLLLETRWLEYPNRPPTLFSYICTFSELFTLCFVLCFVFPQDWPRSSFRRSPPLAGDMSFRPTSVESAHDAHSSPRTLLPVPVRQTPSVEDSPSLPSLSLRTGLSCGVR